ncbi:Alkaline phosphatase synthesis transcriptional regulatory protein PhoP [subsurface metagenome]
MSRKKNILVVDDDNDIVSAMTIILESEGYNVITADSGKACYAILKSQKPDLIILDIMMDSLIDGFNIEYDLKTNPEYKSIPIIMVSSIEKHTGFTIDTNFIKADAFLEKPLDPHELLDSITKFI